MAPNEKPDEKPTTTRIRLIARVLRTVAAGEQFEDDASLKDAVKTRLARLRIDYAPDDLTAALTLVESNPRIVVREPRRVDPVPAADIRWAFK